MVPKEVMDRIEELEQKVAMLWADREALRTNTKDFPRIESVTAILNNPEVAGVTGEILMGDFETKKKPGRKKSE